MSAQPWVQTATVPLTEGAAEHDGPLLLDELQRGAQPGVVKGSRDLASQIPEELGAARSQVGHRTFDIGPIFFLTQSRKERGGA